MGCGCGHERAAGLDFEPVAPEYNIKPLKKFTKKR